MQWQLLKPSGTPRTTRQLEIETPLKVRPHRPSDKVSAPHRGDGGDGNSHKSIGFSVRRRRSDLWVPFLVLPVVFAVFFDEFSGLRI